MVTLSADMVLARSKVESLESIKSLQCWAMKLSDVSILPELVNLQVLNVSCNNLTSLRYIGQCKGLRQIYLRKNMISRLEELQYLKDLPDLHSLWLLGNPISSIQNYRQKVLTYLPQLRQLDQTAVTIQEREKIVAPVVTQNICSHLSPITVAVLTLLPLLDQSSLLQVHHEIQNMLQLRKELPLNE